MLLIFIDRCCVFLVLSCYFNYYVIVFLSDYYDYYELWTKQIFDIIMTNCLRKLETAPVLKGLGRFPSDHWGLLTEWTVTTVTSPTASTPRAVLPIPASDRRVVIDLDA